MPSIAHVINPVDARPPSDLVVAQPLTFESMRLAKQEAAGSVVVELLAVCFDDEQHLLPEGFQSTAPLTRSVLDVGSFRGRRRLPLIADIIERAYEATAADYIVYTNADIGLQPHFYTAIAELIGSGYDAFTINRRTVSNQYSSIADLPLILAQKGAPHPGHDCFVFRRDLAAQFELGSVCIGVTPLGLVLLGNMLAAAQRFRIFDHLFLTFHVGNDKSWRNPEMAQYTAHNHAQATAIQEVLRRRLGFWRWQAVRGFYRYPPAGRNPVMRGLRYLVRRWSGADRSGGHR